MRGQEVNKCECGSYDEWQPCSPNGVEMEPDMKWQGFYRCMNCGNVEQLAPMGRLDGFWLKIPDGPRVGLLGS